MENKYTVKPINNYEIAKNSVEYKIDSNNPICKEKIVLRNKLQYAFSIINSIIEINQKRRNIKTLKNVFTNNCFRIVNQYMQTEQDTYKKINNVRYSYNYPYKNSDLILNFYGSYSICNQIRNKVFSFQIILDENNEWKIDEFIFLK